MSRKSAKDIGCAERRIRRWKTCDHLNISRQPGANIIETVDRIKALMPELRASIPRRSFESRDGQDAVTIRASVKDIQFTLILTVGLVVMVIFCFLRNVWATIIPASRCRFRWSAHSASCILLATASTICR